MVNLLTRLHAYQRSGSLNCAVQLHASTSQFLLDIDQLIAELDLSNFNVLVYAFVFITSSVFRLPGRPG